jgi:Na+/phosphate symporter
MLLRTHYVFSTGILTFLGSLITRDPFGALVFAGIVSVLANTLIDQLGHEMVEIEGKYLPRRTPLTHTWFRSILWGSIVTAVVALFAYFALHSSYYHYSYHYSYFQLRELFTLAVIYGVLVGPTHMFLDVFTERGIYVKRNGRWVRYALAHFRYNDPLANGLAVLGGMLLLFTALKI